HDIQDRCKGFLSDDFHIGADFGYSRSYVESGFQSVEMQKSTFYQKPASLLFYLTQSMQIGIDGFLINQGTHMNGFIERITYFNLRIRMNQFGCKFIINRRVYNKSSGRGASLACCTYRSKYSSGQRHFLVCTWCDDHGIVPTEFQNHLA